MTKNRITGISFTNKGTRVEFSDDSWEIFDNKTVIGLLWDELHSTTPQPEAAAGIPMTKEWIEEAKCGNCGGVGWRAIQVEAGVFEQDQCQWCFEQWQALEQSSEGKS
jgi:hypothetical protein